MSKKSKLKKCGYCGQEIHARGMASHIAFKHANSQVPPPVENTPTQAIETRLIKSGYSATPSREPITATQKHEGLDIKPKYQLLIRSEPTEVVKQKDSGVKTPAKPTKTNWKQVAWIVGVVVLAYYTIPEVRDSLQRHWAGQTYTRGIPIGKRIPS